jgi:hypothetical protein
VQTEALEADAYTPAPQVGHVAVPTLEAKDPAAQPEHAAEVCIPVPVENIPVLQPVQVAEVCMPVPVEYEPETHLVQEVKLCSPKAVEYVPAPQAVIVEVVGEGQTLPTGHCVHEMFDVAVHAAETYWPVEHRLHPVHMAALVDVEKVLPAVQAVEKGC